ncbi:MAG: TrkA family potassium uptake protein [Chloroflexota bacterium]|nr:TrkA family potassium uptake protein [Dehalococcoidia bacterium]MDW8254130.1 TrkA family potassium uptake protein [Chloroflexota bacterium]
MKKQVLVVGLGRFGSAVARTLYRMGDEVLAVDIDPHLVQNVADEVSHAVTADATDPDVLRQLGVTDFDTAVVAIGSNLQASILTTLNLRECGCRYIIAKAVTAQHAKILERVGADRVVFPEVETGVRVAHTLMARTVLDYLDLGPGYGIAVLRLPPSLTGRTVDELALSERYKLTLIALVRGNEVQLHPRRDVRLAADTILVVAGRDADLEAFRD